MTEPYSISRRRILRASSLIPFLPGAAILGFAEEAPSLKGQLYKTLKIGMIKEGETLAEKFAVAKSAGFEGVELNAPGVDVDEARSAADSAGILIDGTVCAGHWQVRHSDPDAAVREEALETLLAALENTHAIGGHTVLLVVGHGKDGTEEEVWERCSANIREAIPLAARLGVTIAVENVWNHFCYDHEGDSTQTADKFAAFVDQFASPFVGMQFDIGNHWKYGDTAQWIRTLGDRIVKLDVKGFSRADGKFTKIGEGDIDFVDVRKALVEIGFHGWCAAEVGGGDRTRLEEISLNMDRAFAL